MKLMTNYNNPYQSQKQQNFTSIYLAGKELPRKISLEDLEPFVARLLKQGSYEDRCIPGVTKDIHDINIIDELLPGSSQITNIGIRNKDNPFSEVRIGVEEHLGYTPVGTSLDLMKNAYLRAKSKITENIKI